MAASAPLPSSARVVVVGGGVGGASVAYHLARAGERDVVLLERSELTSGSTFHSAGLVGVLRADPTLTRMNMHSAELYAELQRGEHPPGWVPSGGLKLASSPERLEEIRRQVSWARTYGLGLEEIGVDEAVELFPLMDPTGVVGAAWLPEDGYVDPSSLCLSLVAGARAGGVGVHPRTRVLGIDTVCGPGGRRRVHRVRTDRGDVGCEVVVDCGGMFAAQIARMVDVRVPIVPMAHQYVVTEPLLTQRLGPRDRPLPTLRDPDWLVYWRQEVDGLVMGGYERNPAPWTASATCFDDIPADFNGRLLPEDWDRFEQIAENSRVRVPAMSEIGIRRMINGPEAFTPDNEFCLGESEVAGFFVAAGFCAHGIAGAGGIGQVMAEWVLEGSPSLDVWHMDIRRFGPAYDSPAYALARTVETYATYYDIAYPHRERTAGRPLRTSPVYAWHATHGAQFGEKAGWERVDWYEANAGAGREVLAAAGGEAAVRPRTWAARSWSPAIAAEHHACRTAVALFDETSFAKIAVSGPDAAALLEHVSAGRVARAVGSVTYTQWLTPRGGIEADVTVTRTGGEEFVVVTGTAFGLHDLSWLRRRADILSAAGAGSGAGGRLDVRAADVTGLEVCYGVFGPQARNLLRPLTPLPLSNRDFPFLSSRTTTLGDVPVRMTRVTFVGELGWEVYASSEYGFALWRLLWEAGQEVGLVAAGYRAIDSLRLEKGYRVWAGDLTPETTPDEAGLSFAVRLDKPGGFVGADALRTARTAGDPRRTLACVTLDDPRAVAVGSEPVRVLEGPHAGEVAGRVTSAGYGYTVGASILYTYLPVAAVGPGTRVEVDLFGEWVGGTVADGVLYDPASSRVRADG